MATKRYVKANNQHIPDYDPNKLSNLIIYADTNNLDGCNMSEYLPYKDLKFDNHVNLESHMKYP